MRAIALTCTLLSTLILGACPEERKELVEEVGGAPKRQVDLAKQRLDQASATANQRLEESIKNVE